MILALGFAACSGSKSSSGSDTTSVADNATEKAIEKTETMEISENFEITQGKLLSTNGLPLLVDFSAEWCPPCRQLKPIFANLKKEYAGKVDLVSIDVDSMPDLAKKYNIESIPALVYISPDGTEVYRTIGFQEESTIKSELAKYFPN